MNVSVGSYWEDFIAELVGTGRYGSATEVVRTALRLIEQDEAELKALQEKIAGSVSRGGGNTDEEVGEKLAAHLGARPDIAAE